MLAISLFVQSNSRHFTLGATGKEWFYIDELSLSIFYLHPYNYTSYTTYMKSSSLFAHWWSMRDIAALFIYFHVRSFGNWKSTRLLRNGGDRFGPVDSGVVLSILCLSGLFHTGSGLVSSWKLVELWSLRTGYLLFWRVQGVDVVAVRATSDAPSIKLSLEHPLGATSYPAERQWTISGVFALQ